MKYLMSAIVLFPSMLFAQSTAQPTLDPVAQGQWIIDLALKFPVLTSIVVLMGSLRLVLKPLFTLIHTFLLNEGWTSADNKVSAIEQSKAVSILYFLLDYVGSVKIPVASAPVVPPKPPTNS